MMVIEAPFWISWVVLTLASVSLTKDIWSAIHKKDYHIARLQLADKRYFKDQYIRLADSDDNDGEDSFRSLGDDVLNEADGDDAANRAGKVGVVGGNCCCHGGGHGHGNGGNGGHGAGNDNNGGSDNGNNGGSDNGNNGGSGNGNNGGSDNGNNGGSDNGNNGGSDNENNGGKKPSKKKCKKGIVKGRKFCAKVLDCCGNNIEEGNATGKRQSSSKNDKKDGERIVCFDGATLGSGHKFGADGKFRYGGKSAKLLCADDGDGKGKGVVCHGNRAINCGKGKGPIMVCKKKKKGFSCKREN